jgi:hypothetical protein
MLLSERIKALAPPGAVYFRMVAHLHDERSVVHPADPSSYFTVGESPYGIPSGYYALSFFTEKYHPIPHHNKSIHINLQGEVQRASQSQLSLHRAGARAHERPLLGAGTTAPPPLNTSVHAADSVHAAKVNAAKAQGLPETAQAEGSDAVEDTELEFRKYTYAMDLEDRQQEFIKNSTYVTEVGEVFTLNRIMRRELMELQRVIVFNAQQAHKEVSQVKSTIYDLLQIQRDVLANAAQNIAHPPAAPPDYVGLGNSALATLREIGVALINRSEPRQPARSVQGSAESPQLPAASVSAREASLASPVSPAPSTPSAPLQQFAPSAPPAPSPDLIERMVRMLRSTTDYDIALAMSSPDQWKAKLDEFRAALKEPPATSPAPPSGDEGADS